MAPWFSTPNDTEKDVAFKQCEFQQSQKANNISLNANGV
jgi:hypothetical protein